jgi:hypothetical protein
LLNIGDEVHHREHATQEKQRDRDYEKASKLNNDCASDLDHRATLIAANLSRKSGPTYNSAIAAASAAM